MTKSSMAASAIAMALSEMTADFMTAEERLADIRVRVKQPRRPSGKNRDKVKAARKQRRKQK